jgi:hypothetical protein
MGLRHRQCDLVPRARGTGQTAKEAAISPLSDPANRPFGSHAKISMGPELTVRNLSTGRRLGVCPTIAATQNGTPSAQANARCGVCQRSGHCDAIPGLVPNWQGSIIRSFRRDLGSDRVAQKRETQPLRRIVDQLQLLASPSPASGIKIFSKASRLALATNLPATAPSGVASLFPPSSRTAGRMAGFTSTVLTLGNS